VRHPTNHSKGGLLDRPGAPVVLGLLLVFGSWYVGTQVQQHEFTAIFLGFGALFAAYAVIVAKVRTGYEVLLFMAVGVLCRAVLLFSLPQLSDDYFRFIWDGRLAIQGIHPFDALPSEYAKQGFPVAGLDAALFEKLNSPDYYTVYPPVAQAIFAFACRIFPGSIAGSVFVMKFLLLLMESGSILLLWQLLRRFNLPSKNVLLYALNPLVIVEIVGNLHFEGAMVFFFLLALYWGSKSKLAFSAGAMALSVASKMLSLLALPFLLRQLGIRKALLYYLIFGAVAALLFAPLLNGAFLHNFGDSLNLYFRQFEFNASLYYIARWIGYEQTGFNKISIIGPLLASIAAMIILLSALLSRHKTWDKLPQALLFAICTYLFFTTTVHPWYLCMPVALSAFSRYRFAVVWSAVAVLSYHKYVQPGLPENLWITGAAYVVVYGFLLWEWLRQGRHLSGD
jgi:alpha-1,6-mannosyltransferase